MGFSSLWILTPLPFLHAVAPRPPLNYIKPLGRDPDKPITQQKLTGVASLLESIKQQQAEAPEDDSAAPPTDTEHQKFLQRQEDRKRKKETDALKQKETFDPTKDPSATGDPYKTLFISKLSKEATEEDLRREFAMYGHIEALRIVRDVETGKSKGYAFILYEREKDMKGKLSLELFYLALMPFS
jgi:U1 small nuclear ribonucleoprotein